MLKHIDSIYTVKNSGSNILNPKTPLYAFCKIPLIRWNISVCIQSRNFTPDKLFTQMNGFQSFADMSQTLQYPIFSLLLRENPDPGSRDPEAGGAPFQTSRSLRRWPGWLARCPSRLLPLLHPLLQESRPLEGNHPPQCWIDPTLQYKHTTSNDSLNQISGRTRVVARRNLIHGP